MVRGSKKGHHKDMWFEEIGLHAQNVLTILGSIVNIIVRSYMTTQSAWQLSLWWWIRYLYEVQNLWGEWPWAWLGFADNIAIIACLPYKKWVQREKCLIHRVLMCSKAAYIWLFQIILNKCLSREEIYGTWGTLSIIWRLRGWLWSCTSPKCTCLVFRFW